MSNQTEMVTEMSDMTGKWGYEEGEVFDGRYDTQEEAAAAFVKLQIPAPGDQFLVGQYERPSPPWEYVDAAVIFEDIACHEEYCGDAADHWPSATKEQMRELDESLTNLVKDWVERHGLMPDWWTVNITRKCVATGNGRYEFVA